MAIGNFAPCNAFTRAREGGDVNDPHDPGGLTSRGVTAAAGNAWRKSKGLGFKVVTEWSEAEVSDFYRNAYWNKMGCEGIPWGADLAVYDCGVNSGVSRSVGWYKAIRPLNEGIALIKALTAKRLGFLHGLKNWSRYGRGWASRVAGVEAAGVAMWLKHNDPKNAKTTLKAEAEAASNISAGQIKGAGVSTAATITGGVALPTDMIGFILVGGLILLAVFATFLFFVKSRQNAARADAYNAALEGVK